MSTESAATTEPRSRKDTAEKLLQAAIGEFNEHGFSGTDTNRIARRAGFAPQTFYRWFRDKVAIFVEAYGRWQLEEAGVLRRLLAEQASDARLVDACIAHHRAHLIFRRSLRQLAVENDEVRAARAEGRLNQIRQIRAWNEAQTDDTAELAVILLQFERLSDALAEGEFRDMRLDEAAAKATLAGLIHRLRAPT